MKEIPQSYSTAREQRLYQEGFRFNRFGELAMSAEEFIKVWEDQHPLRQSLRDREWFIEVKK